VIEVKSNAASRMMFGGKAMMMCLGVMATLHLRTAALYPVVKSFGR
jgi:hypothetical protein